MNPPPSPKFFYYYNSFDCAWAPVTSQLALHAHMIWSLLHVAGALQALTLYVYHLYLRLTDCEQEDRAWCQSDWQILIQIALPKEWLELRTITV